MTERSPNVAIATSYRRQRPRISRPSIAGTFVTTSTSTIEDDKPVKLTIELPAAVHRDLVAYGNVLSRETGQGAIQPAKLIGPMLARFMATDGAFAKERRARAASPPNS